MPIDVIVMNWTMPVVLVMNVLSDDVMTTINDRENHNEKIHLDVMTVVMQHND